MKNILSLMMLGMICISFQRCAEDSAPIFEKQKIQFSFNITSGDITNGRIEVSKLPEGSFLKISINNSSGETVISNLEIPILTFGDSYITEPLELPLGKYFITEFLIVKDSEVLFATPKRHSLLERLVDHPLPYSFNISKDKISNVAMQVLDISSQAPEAFGYASFNIEIVNPFLISVFIPQNGFALAGATAYIIKEPIL